MIPELRRKINDSKIGQKINYSIPGMLVEGASRVLTDTLFMGAIGICESIKDITDNDLSNEDITRMMFNYIIRDMDPKKHYSHTSPVYRQIIRDGKLVAMSRLPIKKALFPNSMPEYDDKVIYTV